MLTHVHRSAYLLGLGLFVVFLSACKMGPDYARPETAKADSWRLTTATAESIANLPWWELLKDQALQQLVRTALAENLDLQIATANIEQFQAQLLIAKYDLVPSLDYNAHALGFRNTNANVLPSDAGGIPATSPAGKSGIPVLNSTGITATSTVSTRPASKNSPKAARSSGRKPDVLRFSRGRARSISA